MSERGHRSIGEVLSLVQEEFPDITISKIRFLESQGLLEPERTPSGYRKFYPEDIERLEWILAQQRDHFLPLKVIRDRLDEWDATGEPPAGTTTARNAEGNGNDTPAAADPSDERLPDTTDVRHAAAALAAGTAAEVVADRTPPARPDVVAEAPATTPTDEPSDSVADEERHDVEPTRPALDAMTAQELADAAGVELAVVEALEDFSMIESRRVGADVYYDSDNLRVVRASYAFVTQGIEVRHLRMYKIAAEREAGVFEQRIMPLLKRRNPEARAEAAEIVRQLSEAGEDLHAALLRRALGDAK